MGKNSKKLSSKLDDFVEEKCEGEACEVKDKKKGEVVEKIQKKLVISDGRQLLREILMED